MIVNSSRNHISNWGQMFFVCTKNGFRSDRLFYFIWRGMFKIVSSWSFCKIDGYFFVVSTSERKFSFR